VATYEQSLADNIAHLQRQINRINTAQMGPVTIAAGDGSMKMLGTDGGEVFSFDESGMYFLHRGSRRNMSVFSDNIVTWLERHDTTLSEHNTRINTAQSDVNRAHSRLDGVGTVLESHNTRIANAGRMALDAQATADNAQKRLDGVGTVLENHNTRIANAGAMASAAQSRADSAYARAGTGISDAASARSRADAAYSLAQGRATQTQIDNIRDAMSTMSSRITALGARVTAIENKIRG
jgi:chromosome segregation ATPase